GAALPERGRCREGRYAHRRVPRARGLRLLTMRAGRRRDTQDPVEMTRRLAALCVELNLSEIDVTAGEVRVRVSRGGPASAAGAPSVTPGAPTAAGSPAGETTSSGLVT